MKLDGWGDREHSEGESSAGSRHNGHVGEGNTGDEEVMGSFCVKDRNLKGQEVVDFAKTMEMAVCAKHHQMVVCKIMMKMRKRKSLKTEQKIRWWKLRKEECCEDFRREVVLSHVDEFPDDWETTATEIRETCRKVLGRKEDKVTWWWNSKVQESVQRKRLAKKRWDSERTEENRLEDKEGTREVKREVAKAQHKAYKELYDRLDAKEG